MKYFCSKCGKTTQYNLTLPKFCSDCGESFNSKINNNELKSKENSYDIVEDTEPIEDHVVNNINFKKIKPSFKLDIYKPKNESLGGLIDNPAKPVNFDSSDIAAPKTQDQILQEFQREAGLSRSQE
jgi:hypothetical protein